MKKAQTYNVIGKAELRNDGAEKVTGKALYTVDVDLPGHGPWQGSAQSLCPCAAGACRWQPSRTDCRECSR